MNRVRPGRELGLGAVGMKTPFDALKPVKVSGRKLKIGNGQQHRLTLPCPTCGKTASLVLDTRPVRFRGRPAIWRRRVCHHCEARFTSYEITAQDLDYLLQENSAAENELLCLKSKIAGWRAWGKKYGHNRP